MGIAAAEAQMKAFNVQLERARKEQEKILSNAKKLDALPGSGGIAGQQALQGGQLLGAGAQALPGDPGGLKALLKSVFRVIGVGGGDQPSVSTTGGGGGGGDGVIASASARGAGGGRHRAPDPRFQIPNRDPAPFFTGFDVNVRQLQATLDLIKALRERNSTTASTRSSR